ncbi:ETR1, partial [Symbiodinium sp. KB8]
AALQQMKALLDRTLDLARFDAGVQQVDMQPLNLASTLASIHRAVMPAYRAAGVTLHWAVEGGLEDVEGGVHVLGDVLRIRQAIMNVLHNGSKYSARGDSVYFSASVAWSDSKRMSPRLAAPNPGPTPGGQAGSSKTPPAAAGEERPEDWAAFGSTTSSGGGGANSRCHLLVRVRDTGRGMTDAEQASIFTPFARLHTAQEGTGLGLNIAKKAMVAHGGDVQVWSAGIGEGCTFTITA